MSAGRARPVLMVLGAGRHQAPLIRRAGELGVDTIAVDYYESPPGKAYATRTIQADALDGDRVAAIAREHGIDGVTTVGTDQAMLVVARVADEFGLPCHLTPDGALKATNKSAMRDALVRAGVAMTDALTVPPDAVQVDSPWYPCVVKAADSQGQRGMHVVHSGAELRDALPRARAASKTETVVLERFHVGPEITINAWMSDGRVDELAVLDRVTYNPPPNVGICLQHVYPSVFHHRDAEFAEIAGAVARGYGMRSGPLYIQAIVTDTGIRVVEAAARVGGGHEAQLLPRLSGVELIDRTIDLALARPHRHEEHPGAPSGIVSFIIARPGRLSRLSDIDDLVARGLVDEGAWYVAAGYEQGPIVDSMGRVGYFIVTAADRAQTLARASDAYGRLEAGEGENLVFWPESALVNAPDVR